jgi:CheY-like chemotaxis protein
MRNKSLQIFYTDDDADDQEFFLDVIREINDAHSVYTQSFGDELLDLLNQPPPQPDIVFLDLNMPVKNGLQVLKEIRSTSGFDHIPIIIFSTSRNEKVIEDCRKFGANLYLPKPNSYTDLKRIMSSLLSMDLPSSNSSANNFVYKNN